MYEYVQLSALIEMLQTYELIPKWDEATVRMMKSNKIRNVLRWQGVPIECGTLQISKESED